MEIKNFSRNPHVQELWCGGDNIMDVSHGEFFFYETDGGIGREEIAELVKHLQAWLETGSLEIAQTGAGE